MIRKKPKFLRLGYTQYSKLGLRRKKKQVYRRANGIDNKVRLRMKGHLRNVSIGFRSDKNERYSLNGLNPVKVNNIKELKGLLKEDIAVIGAVGNRKKFELMEYAIKNNIKVYNINPNKFVEKIKKELENKKEEKIKKAEKKKGKEEKIKKAEKKATEKIEENKTEKDKVEEKIKKEEQTQ